MADSDFKSQVLAATDIVALISQSVALKRRGKNYIGLCPFHQEKTPSFNVDPVKGYFKCFGCKASGNAIDFVMKRDRLDFLEAMKSLGEKAGLEMPRFGVTKQKTSERQALLDAHAKAADFFHRTLLSPIGKPARDYLDSRGFSQETIQSFKIGYVPMGWDNLLRCRELAGIPPGLLALGGLVKARNEGSGHYDTFRNRLMFPIRDEQGRTIAFGGRVMPGSDDPAKYLNSPETPLFSKSRAIFGLDLGRDKIVETRTAAIVEGYTDVTISHQYGATNVVSILGTAMTDQHLAILRRFADRVVLLFDADTAGETAVNRSVELFLTQPIEIAIATLPEDLDPDEYMIKYGAEAFATLLKDAEDALSFKWKLLRREVEASGGSITGQQKAVEAYLELLGRARQAGPVDDLRWGAVLRRVEKHTGIPVETLLRRFGGVSRPGSSHPNGPRPWNHGPARPAVSALSSTSTNEINARVRQDEGSGRAERWILGVLLAEPSRWVHVQHVLSPTRFVDPARRRLADFYWDRQKNEGEPTFSELLGEFPEESMKELAIELLEEVEKLGNLEATLGSALEHLESERRRTMEVKHRDSANRKDVSVEEEIAALRALQESVRKPDIRRGLTGGNAPGGGSGGAGGF